MHLLRLLAPPLALLLLAQPVSAHALGAECKIVGNRVELEAFYDDDTPAIKARVHVLDDQQKEIAEGRTDIRGLWSFPRPIAGKYRVVVDGGAGHRTEIALTVPEQAPGPEKPIISEGPTRQEFTRFPWLKVLLGLVMIAGFSAALLIARHRSRA